MKCEAPKHPRRSLRIPGYDYSEVGPYFVTICTKYQKHMFGKIIGDEMQLNDMGQVVVQEWITTAQLRPYVQLDEFVVMPNHFHGIIAIIGGECRGTARRAPTAFGKPTAGSLPTIVGAFKSAVTKRINELHCSPGGIVWQRGYYEHIIRDEKSLDRTRENIIYNPLSWSLDRENPDRQGEDQFDQWLASFKSRPEQRKELE